MKNKIILSVLLLTGICASLLFIFYSQRGEDIQGNIVPINDPHLETELEDIETDISKMPGIIIDNGDGTQSIVANNAEEGTLLDISVRDDDIEYLGTIIDNEDGTQSLIAE